MWACRRTDERWLVMHRYIIACAIFRGVHVSFVFYRWSGFVSLCVSVWLCLACGLAEGFGSLPRVALMPVYCPSACSCGEERLIRSRTPKWDPAVIIDFVMGTRAHL